MVISFKTLGCRLNQAEEESLRRQFMESGWYVAGPEQADVLVVNTCSVTDLASKKSVRLIKQCKRTNPDIYIVAIGCAAEAVKSLSEINLCISNKNKVCAFELINIEFSKKPVQISNHETQGIFSRTRALLKVQDGCNNFCTYCIVPFLRGREISVPVDKVLNEAKKLDILGYKELVISGVNVGKYRDPKVGDLTELLKLILAKTKFSRIRLSSINPQDITKDLIDLWKEEPRLCRHFHLSLQSGSDGVLKRMARPYSAHKYYSLVKNITQNIPDMAITTDVIVGFPGETENEFNETIKFVKKVKFAKIHVFRYSKRDNTKAAAMPNQVPEDLKKIRAQKLQRVSDDLRIQFLNRFVGTRQKVLFETEKNGKWEGLTSNYIKVRQKSSLSLRNQIKTVVLKDLL